MMSKVLFEKDRRFERISLNRPEKLNAIDNEDPVLLQDSVLEAEKDTRVHVIILSGNG